MADDDIDRDHACGWQFDEWAAFLQSVCGGTMHIDMAKEKRKAFIGWARPVHLFGLPALDHASNRVFFERTSSHARLGPEDYAVSLQLTGRCVASQSGRVAEMIPGDLILLDMTRPGERLDDGCAFTFRLPRQVVVSNLGYTPEGGLLSRGTLAGRVVSKLITEVIKGEHSAVAAGDTHMQMAVYDLFCAAFAKPDIDIQSGSRHTDKLFEQVCCIIRDGMTDPDLTPSKVAAEAGISLRYLQKLFTPRGTTCVHFIHSLRLDYAARLLHRRTIFGGRLPLSEIALASGFRDYTFFSRKFRERFGCVPSTYTGSHEVDDR